MNEQEIFDKLLPLVREVTGARPEQIRPDCALMEDLGAESLDLLDLSFLIEETFGVTLSADEFERRASARLNGEAYERNGFLTEAGVKELRKALPDIPPNKLTPGMPKVALPRVLTVAVFVRIIQSKLVELEGASS